MATGNTYIYIYIYIFSIQDHLLEVICETANVLAARIETKASMHNLLWVVVVVYRIGLPTYAQTSNEEARNSEVGETAS